MRWILGSLLVFLLMAPTCGEDFMAQCLTQPGEDVSSCLLAANDGTRTPREMALLVRKWDPDPENDITLQGQHPASCGTDLQVVIGPGVPSLDILQLRIDPPDPACYRVVMDPAYPPYPEAGARPLVTWNLPPGVEGNCMFSGWEGTYGPETIESYFCTVDRDDNTPLGPGTYTFPSFQVTPTALAGTPQCDQPTPVDQLVEGVPLRTFPQSEFHPRYLYGINRTPGWDYVFEAEWHGKNFEMVEVIDEDNLLDRIKAHRWAQGRTSMLNFDAPNEWYSGDWPKSSSFNVEAPLFYVEHPCL